MNMRKLEKEVVIPVKIFSRLMKVRDELDSIMETIDILRNKKLMESIKKAREDVRKGRVYKLKDLDELWK